MVQIVCLKPKTRGLDVAGNGCLYTELFLDYFINVSCFRGYSFKKTDACSQPAQSFSFLSLWKNDCRQM